MVFNTKNRLIQVIKLPFVIKAFVLSIFEWPFYIGFNVSFYISGWYFSQYSKFRVYLSNSSDTFGDPVFTHDSSYDYLSSKNHIVKLYLPNILTRFVKIDRDTSILTICDLKLYEGGKNIK